MDSRTLVTVAVVLLVGLHGVAGTAMANPDTTVNRATVIADGGSVTETLTYEFTAPSNDTASVRGQITDGEVGFEFVEWQSLDTNRDGTGSSWQVRAGNSYRVTYEATVTESASGYYDVETVSGFSSPAWDETLTVDVLEPAFGYVSTQQTELVFESNDQASTTLDVPIPNDGQGLMIPADVTFSGVPDGVTLSYSQLPGSIPGGESQAVTLDMSTDSSVDKGSYQFTATVEDNLGNTLDVPVEVTVRKPPVLEAGDNGAVDLGDVLVGSDKTVDLPISETGGYTGIDGVNSQVTQSDQYGSISFDDLRYLSTDAGGSSNAEVTVSVEDSANQHSNIGFTAYLEPDNQDGVGQSVSFTGRVIYPPRFGDVSMPDTSMVFDEPQSQVSSYTETVTVEVPNAGDQTMNVQGVSASTDSGQVSASVADYDGQIDGQSSGEVVVEVEADPTASEGSYSLSVDVNSQEDGTETVTSSVGVTHEVALSVERTSLGFGDVVITENLTQSTDVAETLEYQDVTDLSITKESGPDQWLTVVERPPERLTAGDAAPFVVAVQFDTGAELYREYTWEYRVEGDGIDAQTITVTATPEPVSLEGIRSPLADRTDAGGWQADTASGMVDTLDQLETKLRDGGEVSRTDLSTGIAAGRSTILFIESVENATGTLESEGNEAAQPEVVKAAATYNLLDSYIANLEDSELRSTANESRTAARDRVNSLVDQQRSYYEDQLESGDVTMIERAHINRQLAQLASLQGDEQRAERLRAESAGAFENYTATVQQGNEQRQSARQLREEMDESMLTVVLGQPLMLNPAKWDAFETTAADSLSGYDDAESSFATAGASEEAQDVADERQQAASRYQFARLTMYGSTAAYGLVFLALLGYLGRNTYAYVRDAREAVSGDFLVAS
ncbi:hypothetical protein [Halorussus litoreus]|uniref:hypothetical protein n=1 Tax=Halorussus litoreus TaxID=1710536 RepID=UPI000E223E53|nr:hypothetical protein [Halorussus litoreus]